MDEESISAVYGKVSELTNKWSYVDLSSKTNYNFEVPFLYIARYLTNDRNLMFTETIAMRPPEVKIDENLIRSYSEKNNEKNNEEKEKEKTKDKNKVKNHYMKVPDGLYNLIVDILDSESSQLRSEFEDCKY
jgi:hypothetical protein